MSEFEIKYLQSQLNNQEKCIDSLNETIRKLTDKYYKATMWLMLLTYGVFFSLLTLHDHRHDINLIQTNQKQEKHNL